MIWMEGYLSKFFYVLSGRKKELGLLTALATMASILEAFGIGMVGPFIAVATNPESPILGWFQQRFSWPTQQIVLFLGLTVVVVFYIKTFVSFCVQRYIFQYGYRQQGLLCSRLMYAYSRAPYTYHLNHNSAELTQNMISETELFTNRVLLPLLFLGANVAVITAIVILLVVTNAIAVVIVGGVFFVSFLLINRFKGRVSGWGRDRSEAYEEMIRIINHSFGGLKEIRVIGCEPYFERQANTQMMRYANSASSFFAFTNLPRYTMEAFLVTFLVVFTFLFLQFSGDKPENLNAILGIFAMASIRMLPAVTMVINGVSDIRYATSALDRIYLSLQELEKIAGQSKLLPYNPDWVGKDKEISPMHFDREVALDQVTYRYPGSAEYALKGVSLNLKKGESIGLIGRSGAGKTTLVDVILGLLDLETGQISVDGVSIYDDLASWQHLIGYVPQTIFLTDDTLERNIAFGVPDPLIDQNRLQKAIEIAQLTELVERLPQGINTILGERGMRLSGGQRQRVGIARTIYHDREILVFDEATAALDNETESLVSEAVKALGGLKTMIIIAHRLTTVEHCDRIYMMERGQVVKSGTYEEVVLNSSPAPRQV
ncbi:ABC transporter ATP-binding protein [Alkalinema pantanalense CENA528]|uniref:ABC transporter ATP-binding protein n=1 Tax=Alkalinema pantanalense TaxID=1620705 RepID=UPI003D6DBE4E